MDDQVKKVKTKKPSDGRRVGLAQMVESIKGDKKKEIEKKLKKLTKKKVVELPLESNERELIERKLNYSKATKQVTKWDRIVKERATSRQLQFPLNEEPRTLPSPRDVLVNMKPSTDLEVATNQILKKDSDYLDDQSEFTKAEEKFLKSISLEEAKERHTELQKMRALVSHYGAKMKRQKAIKSKSYHRRLKHERKRIESKKIDTGANIISEIQKLEKLRAHERATLKHKTSKWAKHAKIQAKYDKNARQAIMDQQALSEKYSSRPRKSRNSDDSSSDSEESDSDQEDENVEAEEEEEEEEEDEEEQMEDDFEEQNDEPFPTAPTYEQRSRKSLDSKEMSNLTAMEVYSDNDDDDNDNEQRKLISEAFADDDVVKEFDAKKKEVEDAEQPKDLDLYLPGWNEWAGPGIVENKKKKERLTVKAKKVNRRDSTMGNVIISEVVDGNIKQYAMKKLPFPFKSEEALADRISEPVSGSFRDQLSFREITKPRVVTKLGAKIEPMHLSELTSHSSKLSFKT